MLRIASLGTEPKEWYEMPTTWGKWGNLWSTGHAVHAAAHIGGYPVK